MPVYQIEDEMPHDEFRKWMIYLRSRPIGWRDDQRAFLQIKAQGFKGKPTDIFPSLRPVYEQAEASRANRNPMPSGGFLAMLQNAQGGDEEAKSLFKGGQKDG